MLTIPELALPAGVGAAVTLLVPLVLRRGWSKTARRWWSILITAGAAGLVLALDPAARAEPWENITASLGVAIGAGHAAYTLLNPLGVYDLIAARADPTPPQPPAPQYQPQRASQNPEGEDRDVD